MHAHTHSRTYTHTLPAAELEERTSEAKVELKRLRKENQELLQRVEVTGFQEPRNAMDRYGNIEAWEWNLGTLEHRSMGMEVQELMVQCYRAKDWILLFLKCSICDSPASKYYSTGIYIA